MTNEERYKYRAAFWMNVAFTNAFRNIAEGFEQGDFDTVFRRMVEYTISTGMSAGVWRSDDVDTTGMDEEEIARENEWRERTIPWSIVEECCQAWGIDPNQAAEAYWQGLERDVAENRSFLYGGQS